MWLEKVQDIELTLSVRFHYALNRINAEDESFGSSVGMGKLHRILLIRRPTSHRFDGAHDGGDRLTVEESFEPTTDSLGAQRGVVTASFDRVALTIQHCRDGRFEIVAGPYEY